MAIVVFANRLAYQFFKVQNYLLRDMDSSSKTNKDA